MAESTLAEVFGIGASQTDTTITITKADLPGLTASANNTAESLVVGLMLLLRQNLPQSSFDSNLDQSIYLADGFPTFAFRGVNNDQYRVDQFTVNFAKPDTDVVIDPDNY